MITFQNYTSAVPPPDGLQSFRFAPMPNPVGLPTRIGFAVPQREAIRIGVYDVSGRLVADVFNGVENAGLHWVAWNGTDRGNSAVGRGVYWLVARTGRQAITKRLIFLR